MIIRKRFWLCLLALGLSQQAAAETGVFDDSIRLGMVNVQTGPASALGKGMLSGALAVFEHVNANGGVNGRQIELLVADDGYEPRRTIDETYKMIEENEVFSLFGFVGTPTANAIIPIVEDLEIPLVGLFTGADSLRHPVIPEIFNIRASYEDETEAIVQHFLNRGAKSVGIFYQNDGFGKAVLRGTRKALKKRGMRVHVSGTYKRNTDHVKPGLGRILRKPPDALVMVGTYTPLAKFVNLARESGLHSTMATVSFVGTSNLIEALGPSGEGIVISQVVPHPQSTGVALVSECRDKIAERSGETLDHVNLEGCLSAKVMVEALRQTGRDLNRASLIQTMEKMTNVTIGDVVLGFSADNHQALDQVYLTEIRGQHAVNLD